MHGSMKILVTGANGQVGHELLRALADGGADRYESHPLSHFARVRFAPPFVPKGEDKRDAVLSTSFVSKGQEHPLPQEGGRAAGAGGWAPSHEIIPATRNGTLADGTLCESIDLADFAGLVKALDRIAPDIIVNAAAYTAVDRAEDEPELAQRVNGDAPGVIGAWAQRYGARVVHYSTDYVFDGSATRPYRETDATHPVSVYGHSKLAGEDALRASGARHLVFRTAWVYAARGHNFLRTMLRLGAERDELRVVDDQVGAPTPARLIAEVTAHVGAQWSADSTATRDGVYDLVASGQTSWCGFARAIFERAQRAGLIERAPVVHAIGTADFPTRAKRPAFSVLDTTKLRGAFGVDLPDWQGALGDVIDELRNG
jgi:dTDP-4-dehydrorhamnose reductase